MKTKPIKNNLLWSACLGACLPFSVAQAVPQYTVSDLGSLGGIYSAGQGINNSGVVSGFSYLPGDSSEHSISGLRLTLPQDLKTLGGIYSQAYSVNNLGQMVGSSTLTGDQSYHAFQLNAGALVLKDLKALVATGNSRAFSINDNGQVTGFSTTALGAEHAVRWQNDVNNTISDLGTLDGTGNSQGIAINSTGQVAGFSSLTGIKSTHAVLWAANGTKKDLGTLGGTHSAAFGINASGQVAGSSTLALDAAQHAFLWQPTSVPPMSDLGTLGGSFSEAHGISSLGDVVGYSTTANNALQKAFLWQSGLGLQDLNGLIDPLSGWTLLEAQAISEDGNYITGVGTFTGVGIAGERHAFLLKKIVTDTTAPLISYTLTPAVSGATGWYTAAPGLVWAVKDPESAISSKVGCVDAPAVSDTAGSSFSCQATSAGGTAAPVTTTTLKVDTVAPVLATMPTAFTQAATALNGAVASYVLPTATDSLSGVSAAGVSCLPASGATFALGATPVNCSVNDVAGNTASSSFTVTVADQTPPVLVAVPPAFTQAATGLTGAVVNYTTPTASDSISGVSPVGVSCLPASGSTFALGATPVNCSVKDVAGNTASASFTVTVADQTPPVLTGVPVAFTQAATGLTGAVVTYTAPTATDSISGVSVAGVSCLPTSGVTFAIGATSVNCSVKDVAGNTASASFTVTVADQTPPVLAGVPVAFTQAATSVNGAVVTYTAPTATDSISGVSAAGVSCLPASATTFALGATPVNCSVKDVAGNTASANFVVTVADQTPPVLVGVPVSFTRVATSVNGAVVTYTAPTATDAISGLSPAGGSCLPVSGSTFAIGATPVNCSIKDVAGNTASASFVVTVTNAADTTPPVITANLTGTAGLNGWFTSPVAVAWSVTDAQSAVTSAACAPVSITTNGLNQTRSCVATSAGGTATGNTPAINIDTLAPVFGSCPATVALTQGQTLSQPVATDNLSAVFVTGAPASLAVGTTAVTWKATDQAGLSSSCVQQVTVVSTIPTPVPPAIIETINIVSAQCKRPSPTATTGQWTVQGTSTNSTNNRIQLYSTATVPVTLATSTLGAAIPVVGSQWKFQNLVGPVCPSGVSTLISLRSTGGGSKNNIAVTVQ